MTVLVTGGAGYIGSHVAKLLIQAGHEVVVVDNLSTGIESRNVGQTSIKLELSSPTAVEDLTKLMLENRVDSVIHLAAMKQVGESVDKPEEYFLNNLGGQANLLLAMRSAGVKKLVFSSSAASYGMPEVESVSEDLPASPINPYGQTKLVGEWMCQNAERAWGLRQVSLRYFNVAGSGWPELADTQKLNLIPIVFAQIKAGKDPEVFGNDYPTEDGSCVRDYVHVLDLARAHIQSLDYLASENCEFDVFNVGSGKGSSVFEVLDQIRETTGLNINAQIKPRRAGDPPKLVADVSRIEKAMGWKAQHNLKDIVDSAWQAINS